MHRRATATVVCCALAAAAQWLGSPSGAAARPRVRVLSVAPEKGGSSVSGFHLEAVRFRLVGASGSPTSYSCTVVLRHGSRVVARSGFTGTMAAAVTVSVPVTGAAFVGRPADARVSCTALDDQPPAPSS